MADTASHSSEPTQTTVTEQIEPPATAEESGPSRDHVVLRLKLKPKKKKRVGWTTETVDNENMNKMKSKCTEMVVAFTKSLIPLENPHLIQMMNASIVEDILTRNKTICIVFERTEKPSAKPIVVSTERYAADKPF